MGNLNPIQYSKPSEFVKSVLLVMNFCKKKIKKFIPREKYNYTYILSIIGDIFEMTLMIKFLWKTSKLIKYTNILIK